MKRYGTLVRGSFDAEFASDDRDNLIARLNARFSDSPFADNYVRVFDLLTNEQVDWKIWRYQAHELTNSCASFAADSLDELLRRVVTYVGDITPGEFTKHYIVFDAHTLENLTTTVELPPPSSLADARA